MPDDLLPCTERAGCGQAGLCASGSGGEWERGAWLVVEVAPSSMASTAWMGLKPASHGSHHWPPRVLTLQRRRGMDAAAQAQGPTQMEAIFLQVARPRALDIDQLQRRGGVTDRSGDEAA